MEPEKREVGYRPIICIYPGFKHWLERNCLNIRKFSEISRLSERTLQQNLSGKSELKMYTIRRILETTGLTFEQAFGEVIDIQEARKYR